MLERVRKFNNSLDRLMRLYTEGALSSIEFIGILTEEASLRLQVQRASAWVLDEEQSQIECIDLYETLNGQHSSGAILYASDFPKYFDAVITERVITASDARTDPRTSEFTEVYLKPNRVISMLDTQIRSAGGARGVICLETVDEYREWSPDEAAYAASLAELIGF
ncbi:MAG: GAF domain-containing protein, partial [Pseudomonadota bacterium]